MTRDFLLPPEGRKVDVDSVRLQRLCSRPAHSTLIAGDGIILFLTRFTIYTILSDTQGAIIAVSHAASPSSFPFSVSFPSFVSISFSLLQQENPIRAASAPLLAELQQSLLRLLR
jgi:hypothetical protein